MPVLSFDPFCPGQREDDRPPVAVRCYDSDAERLAVTILPSKSAELPRASNWLAAKIELSGQGGHPQVRQAACGAEDEEADKLEGARGAPGERPIKDPKSNPNADSAPTPLRG
jgi:hypothetical protein